MYFINCPKKNHVWWNNFSTISHVKIWFIIQLKQPTFRESTRPARSSPQLATAEPTQFTKRLEVRCQPTGKRSWPLTRLKRPKSKVELTTNWWVCGFVDVFFPWKRRVFSGSNVSFRANVLPSYVRGWFDKKPFMYCMEPIRILWNVRVLFHAA